ncbi:MAG TPA: hypothetical protein VKC60_03945 [Opitutaceae bacterium]|nr:hypothetical protein [Opitutaceae bacterium]
MKIITVLLCVLLAGCASHGNYSRGSSFADAQSQIAPNGAVLPTFTPSGFSRDEVLTATSSALLLFGGQGHHVFLGCVNCNAYDSNSVHNEYGTYGSKYSGLSIWNPYGVYGSRYSDDSPWNEYASNPPVVVDNAGNFYGYFTVNVLNPKRTRIRSLLVLLAANLE